MISVDKSILKEVSSSVVSLQGSIRNAYKQTTVFSNSGSSVGQLQQACATNVCCILAPATHLNASNGFTKAILNFKFRLAHEGLADPTLALYAEI